jgi:hypothetical protein
MYVNYFVVGIVFITLKLLNVIAWEWVWILSPFWLELIVYTVKWFVEIVMLSLSKSIMISKLSPELQEKYLEKLAGVGKKNV